MTTDYTDFTDACGEWPSCRHGSGKDLRGIRVAMLQQGVTADIIGAAMVVLNALRPGLDEKLYERALVIELRARGHAVEQRRGFDVEFRGHHIGRLVPDLIIDDAVVVDAKVVSTFTATHIAQMLGYLNITQLHVAL